MRVICLHYVRGRKRWDTSNSLHTVRLLTLSHMPGNKEISQLKFNIKPPREVQHSKHTLCRYMLLKDHVGYHSCMKWKTSFHSPARIAEDETCLCVFLSALSMSVLSRSPERPPADVHIMSQAIGSGDWRWLVYNHLKLRVVLLLFPKNLQRESAMFQHRVKHVWSQNSDR